MYGSGHARLKNGLTVEVRIGALISRNMFPSAAVLGFTNREGCVRRIEDLPCRIFARSSTAFALPRAQLQFGSIPNTEAEYDDISFYHGYVESGAFDSCGTYQVDITWVLFSTKIGFSADKTYKVTLDDLTSDGSTTITTKIFIYQIFFVRK